MTDNDFTCLIPAFNEAQRIPGVLQVILGHALLGDVIVVDDGSTDGTGDIARSCGARVIRTPGNLGKTGALLLGLAEVSTRHVVLIDADLIGLTCEAITALICPVLTGKAGASISLRGNAPLPWRMIGIDYISGERVIPRAILAGHEAALKALPRFGFEVYLNQLLIAQDTPLAIVSWPQVASPSKASKRGLLAGMHSDAGMMIDIFRTIGMAQCLRQIQDMRRLAVVG
jgi:glycosyltransferase involved in cell wall biosynthesis